MRCPPYVFVLFLAACTDPPPVDPVQQFLAPLDESGARWFGYVQQRVGIPALELTQRYKTLSERCLISNAKIIAFHKKLTQRTGDDPKDSLLAIPGLCDMALATGRDL